jgi:hypothetical protein
VAPELGDGALLALLVARVEPRRTGAQGVQQQTIGAAGARGEQVLPGAGVAVQAGAGDEPVEQVEVLQNIGQEAASPALLWCRRKVRCRWRSNADGGTATVGNCRRQKW